MNCEQTDRVESITGLNSFGTSVFVVHVDLKMLAALLRASLPAFWPSLVLLQIFFSHLLVASVYPYSLHHLCFSLLSAAC